MEKVIIIDKNNRIIGTEEKLKAHQTGKLHKAFSVLIFNKNNQLLLQQRAKTKYHCGGLWSNTCCSHPRPNESLIKGANRKLKQEMGFNCKLKKLFSFTYKIKLDNQLIEHEYDTIFIGTYEKDPKPNSQEVMNYKWLTLEQIKKEISRKPKKYTPWFKIIIKKFREQNEY
jgi:isopentenyl-diphosphate delta-isomerase